MHAKEEQSKSKEFKWQHIEFKNGSNPYISTHPSNFRKWQKNWDLELIKETENIIYWIALQPKQRKGK